ncbi:MAG: hypothetical protein EOP54_18670 [Sphingobacteriales bacterium]|nr:MAG: hypothetical protein EOP54_18670 [Sphingobacteriales bacterium]
MSLNLEPLLDNNLISVARNFDNGTLATYQVTDVGTEYLQKNFKSEELMDYVNKLDQPNVLTDITEAYIKKKDVS